MRKYFNRLQKLEELSRPDGDYFPLFTIDDDGRPCVKDFWIKGYKCKDKAAARRQAQSVVDALTGPTPTRQFL